MTTFRPELFHCDLGYDCSSLNDSAHRLERSPEFKRAAARDFAANFDVWRQDRSFRSPYAGTVPPTTVLRPDAYGDVDPADVLALADEHLGNHVRGTRVAAATNADESKCIWDPILQRWINIGGYHIELDGQPYTAAEAVTEFDAAYRANRPQLPVGYDDDLKTLRAMRVSLFVSWPV